MPSSISSITAGLDVGGAHLKVALADGDRIIAADQFLCPLWQGLDKLDAALDAARPMTDRAAQVAVTMTGELSDLFASRREGVDTLVGRLADKFGAATLFWMGNGGFGQAEAARASHAAVGSANFLATAVLVGRILPDALLIDFGSTTTDIVPIVSGKPTPRGLTDAQRQVTGELVYSGFTRTAVMGVAQRAPLDGQWVTLAREYLATMADVRRILGSDLADVDLHATADGKGKSLAESVSRFARLLGRDAADASFSAWTNAAAYVRDEQLRSIADGARLVLSAQRLPEQAPVIAAGTGEADVLALARTMGRPAILFGALIQATPPIRQNATWSAPASALALLASADRRSTPV